jgi:hypothetical protein
MVQAGIRAGGDPLQVGALVRLDCYRAVPRLDQIRETAHRGRGDDTPDPPALGEHHGIHRGFLQRKITVLVLRSQRGVKQGFNGRGTLKKKARAAPGLSGIRGE